jgi:sugar lactone lactonase YvrE
MPSTLDSHASIAVAGDALLGESPLWSAGEDALYFVDIKSPRLFRHDLRTGGTRITSLREAVGAIALRRRGGLIAAARSGFAFIDSDGTMSHAFHRPEAEPPRNRFNDGKCDRAGRFWAASMDDAEQYATGNLYCLDAALQARRAAGGFVIGNGLGWSPDDRIFYFTDSVRRRIYAYDFDRAAGAIANRRVFAAIADDAGFPDGLCVDADGYVWSAHWDGWRVTRYAPDGRIAEVLPMPVPRPTSCAFGGADLATLFVTSARVGLDAASLARAPLSGSVLAVRTGRRGLPEPYFEG